MICDGCGTAVVERDFRGATLAIDAVPRADGNVQLVLGGECRVLEPRKAEEWRASGRTLYRLHTCGQK